MSSCRATNGWEIRRHPDDSTYRPGEIDEVIAHDVQHVHVEQMDDGHWWMGLTFADGRMLHVDFATRRKAEIRCVAEER